MNPAAFYKAARTEPPVCLRLRLQPLTIGHLVLLSELQSPFVCGGAASLYDLLLAVFICSQPQDKARAAAKAWWAGIFFRVWAWSLRNAWKKGNPMADFAAFQTYLLDQQDGPQCNRRFDGKMRLLGTPPLEILRVRLISDLHMSFSDCMNLTVLEAKRLTTARHELDGGSVWNEEQEELWQFKLKMDALKAEKAAAGRN